MNKLIVSGLFTAFCSTLISGCGNVESSQHKSYAPGFSIISAQLSEAPKNDDRFQLTAGHDPARFKISWNLTELGRHTSYTAGLYLSRDNLVDRTDKAVSTIQCDNFDTKGCGYSASFDCDYTATDAIHCLDNSRSHAPDLSEHLRATGQWPWQGNLILEFCLSGTQQCLYSSAFPITLDKSTANNAENLKKTTKAITGVTLPVDSGIAAPHITVSGASEGNGIITVEPDSANNRFELGWDETIDYLSQSVNLVLSKDPEFSFDDFAIYNQFMSYDKQGLECRFTPMNEFICGNDRAQKLSNYFVNSGGMPWEGFLLVHFMPNSESPSTMKYVIPMKLQY